MQASSHPLPRHALASCGMPLQEETHVAGHASPPHRMRAVTDVTAESKACLTYRGSCHSEAGASWAPSPVQDGDLWLRLNLRHHRGGSPCPAGKGSCHCTVNLWKGCVKQGKPPLYVTVSAGQLHEGKFRREGAQTLGNLQLSLAGTGFNCNSTGFVQVGG